MSKYLLYILFLPAVIYGQIELKFEYSEWLRDDEIYTDQTSGIAYIGKGENGDKSFILADDVGEIFLMSISSDEKIHLKKFGFSDEVRKQIDLLPKKDFEEISYDRFNGSVYLSIEANSPFPKITVGIYKMNFRDGDIRSCFVEKLTKLPFFPEGQFLEYVENNVGFEGICADENYFYLGLEGFQKGRFFADSTIIYVADKKTLEIKKRISTKSVGIGTICGLYAEGNGILWIMDRNSARIMKVKISGDVLEKEFEYTVSSCVPGTEKTGYTMALESITLDDEGFVYCVDDPWRTFYIPGSDVLETLPPRSAENFKKYIPIIYKLRIIH